MEQAELLQGRRESGTPDPAALEDWFSRKRGRPTTIVAGKGPADRNGFSGETLFVDASDATGWSASYVLRLAPHGPDTVFPPGSDLLLEAEVQRELNDLVPVPGILATEADENVAARPFYVMNVVAGRIPCDNPGHHKAGWLAELPPAAQRETLLSGVAALADLARVNPPAALVERLQRPALGITPLEQDLAYYEEYWRWGRNDLTCPAVDVGYAWARANRPDEPRLSICWGDARPGNIIYDGTRVAALIDWEMVTLGSGEKDLGYWLMMERLFGTILVESPLPGAPTEGEIVALYEERRGWPVDRALLAYHKRFSALRMATIYTRFVNIMRSRGVIPAEFHLDAAGSPAIRLVEEVFASD